MTGVEELNKAIDTAREVTTDTDCHMGSYDGQTEIMGVRVFDTAKVILFPGQPDQEGVRLHASDTHVKPDGGAVKTLVYLNLYNGQPDCLVTRTLGPDGQPEGDDIVITNRAIVIQQAIRAAQKVVRETEGALDA